MSIRVRVLAAMLTISALGMLGAGVAAYIVQSDRLDDRIRAAIAHEVAEFSAFASVGLARDTGEPIQTVYELLFNAMRAVPEEAEGMLGIVEGEPVLFAAEGVRVRLEDYPELVEAAAAVTMDDAPQLRTVESRGRQLMYVAIPVAVAGQPETGVFVIGYDRDIEQEELVEAYQTYALVALIALVVIALLGWLVAGRLLEPIRLLRETAQRISETDLTERIEVSGRDELAALGRTVNAMLDRLQSAFETQRDVLDDAGHELRTPITIVRGHLEIMDSNDPVDVAETRALALDELDRMHGLVEEIVLLAKAKRPDFVKLQPTDLGLLNDNVLDKARPLAQRRWTIDARADAVVDLDPQRITQALLQLVANAVKYTETGQTIAIGSEVRADTVRLWVRDSGTGIEPADVDRIFERFARAGAGRGVEGSGLGLSIVEAIVTAHHGRVDVDSQVGRGSVFTLELPLLRGQRRSQDDDETVEEPA